MKMSVRDARAQFAAAIAAAERGERVLITRNGQAVAELGPPSPESGLDWAALEAFRRAKGWAEVDAEQVWPSEFDDPDFSRRALMLDREQADSV
ncbi:MAG TPA: type II toxin-antitoxin system prevent-host-death family antitoxin [Sphingomonas sp.]|jgi:prevent-host-death family protein|uniref:type II toxin-antitoxin system prevent-host-death family antitoxin n=1 Tax=Sphingomonas sp. TaxID=28214 RepID=UPI002ED791DA